MRIISDILILASIVVIFAGCSSSIDTADKLLTNKYVSSQNTPLKVRLPNGWFEAVDNEFGAVDIWMIKDDMSQSMSIIPINPDNETQKEISEKGISILLNYSKSFKRAELGSEFKNLGKDEFFRSDMKSCAAYRYTGKNSEIVRVAVFQISGKFYEFSAIYHLNDKSDAATDELFRLQNSILNAIK